MSHDAVRTTHAEVDRVTGILLAEGVNPDGSKGVTLTCGKGCSACCYEPVFAEAREVALIAARLLSFDPEVRSRVLARTRAWLATFRASPLLGEENPHVLPYRQLRLACPLLEGGECLVYDDRPSECRLHMAIGPRELCEDDARRLEQTFVSNHDLTMGTVMKLATLVQKDRKAELLMEHLGLLLAEALLGERVESGKRTLLQLNFEEDLRPAEVEVVREGGDDGDAG